MEETVVLWDESVDAVMIGSRVHGSPKILQVKV